jgi:taurine dioxygenase
MATQTIQVTPIAGALGAEIAGVDLSGDPGNAAFDAIHRAFLDHLVLVFRDQTLTPQQQVAFAGRFGEPGIYPFIKGLPDAPEVTELLKTETDTINFGRYWHSDTTYMEAPARATVLYAHDVPAFGGDTQFANMYLAYDALSDGMKALLGGLRGVNSSAQKDRGGRAAKMQQLAGMKGHYIEAAETLEAEHPVIRTHPETGRKFLYVNGSHTVRFAGMTEEESRPLLAYLAAHAVRPEFTCRVRWQPGTLVVWDNRCTQHQALNDYQGQRRRMHRVTVEGDRPY